MNKTWNLSLRTACPLAALALVAALLLSAALARDDNGNGR
jgi:hypothetical protein